MQFSGMYYKPVTIVNDDARVVNKLEASLTDDPRVVTYDRHMFIVQATKLELSSSFGCDRIHNCQRYELWSHFLVQLKSDLDVQQTHLW